MCRAVNVKREQCDVYCGRTFAGRQDIGLGNPHKVGWCSICRRTHTRGEAVEAFRKDFESSALLQQLALRLIKPGDRCGCWCKPNACHVDVIVDFINRSHKTT